MGTDQAVLPVSSMGLSSKNLHEGDWLRADKNQKLSIGGGSPWIFFTDVLDLNPSLPSLETPLFEETENSPITFMGLRILSQSLNVFLYSKS